VLHAGGADDLVVGDGNSNGGTVTGGGRDKLFGQGGPDDLDGGPRRDKCAGGPGTDTAVNCEVRTSIP
jgi:hypothetical protein